MRLTRNVHLGKLSRPMGSEVPGDSGDASVGSSTLYGAGTGAIVSDGDVIWERQITYGQV